MTCLPLRAVVLATAMAVALPSSAQNSVSASMENFRYVLTDLDTTDTIAPSLSWSADSGRLAIAGAGFFHGPTGQYAGEFKVGEKAFAPIATSHSMPGHAAKASLSGAFTPAMHMSASVDMTIGVPTHDGYADVWSDIALFDLSPRTAVTFFMDAVMDHAFGQATPLYDDPRVGSTASVSITGQHPQSPFGTMHSGHTTFLRPGAADLHDARTLSLTFQNTTGAVADYGVFFAASVTSVPEPSAYVLMCAGLGLLGLGAIRRRSYPAAPVPAHR